MAGPVFLKGLLFLATRRQRSNSAEAGRSPDESLLETDYTQSQKLPARGARKPSEDEQDGSFGSESDNE